MKIILNGKETEVGEKQTILTLLESYQLNPQITIVEKNRQIIAREKYGTETLAEQDSLELIRYMGGG